AYDKIKNNVSYIGWKYEPTNTKKLHVQIYMQFHPDKRQTLKSAKQIFNEDNSLIFQQKLNGTSTQNRAYILKLYDRCKKHLECQCTLPKEVVGLFEFGEFREIEKKYTKRKKQDINELKADEFQGAIDGNKIENKNKIPYCRSYEAMTKIYNDLQIEKQKEKEDFGQDFVLLDEFYTKIDWNDLVTLCNDTNETVEQKHK
ncbi:8675_t:CDS:2, partial [Racocetra fulgida]